MRLLSIALLIVGFCLSSTAQNELESKPLSIGLDFKTNGWGISAGKILKHSPTGAMGFDLSLTTLKHSKEVKIQSYELANPIPYVFGKARRGIQFNPSVFYSYKLGAASANTPAVYFGLELGPSIGITRPVYVYYIAQDQNSVFGQQLRSYDREVHKNQTFIQGDAGWNRGFGELRYQAGLHTSIYTELLRNSEYIYQRVKVGMNVDYYFSDLGLMLDNPNQMFTSLFLRYQFAASH